MIWVWPQSVFVVLFVVILVTQKSRTANRGKHVDDRETLKVEDSGVLASGRTFALRGASLRLLRLLRYVTQPTTCDRCPSGITSWWNDLELQREHARKVTMPLQCQLRYNISGFQGETSKEKSKPCVGA